MGILNQAEKGFSIRERPRLHIGDLIHCSLVWPSSGTTCLNSMFSHGDMKFPDGIEKGADPAPDFIPDVFWEGAAPSGSKLLTYWTKNRIMGDVDGKLSGINS